MKGKEEQQMQMQIHSLFIAVHQSSSSAAVDGFFCVRRAGRADSGQREEAVNSTPMGEGREVFELSKKKAF
jgi:hypothetical protein